MIDLFYLFFEPRDKKNIFLLFVVLNIHIYDFFLIENENIYKKYIYCGIFGILAVD